MGFRMFLLFVVVLAVNVGAETTTGDDIWNADEVVDYGAISIHSDCTVSGSPGLCVDISKCKTIHHGERYITYRSSRKCTTGVCCVLSDVLESHLRTTFRPTLSSSTTTSEPTTLDPSPNPSQVGCGMRNENGNFFRGATDIKHSRFGEFPWTVAIYKVVNGQQDKYTCVGSLIHPRVVLTIANRFDRGGKFKIRAGDWYLPSVQETLLHEERNVESMVIHEAYSSGSGANDIGLLFLDRDVLRDMHINYACLPDTDQVTQPSTTCLVSGWGQATVDGPIQETQKFVELPLVNRDICQTQIRAALRNPLYNLDSSMICAGGDGQDACKGDGGAPLVCPYPGQNLRYYQAGIVSWGKACQVRGVPGVYSNVAHLRKWVDEKITAKGYTTNYYTPLIY